MRYKHNERYNKLYLLLCRHLIKKIKSVLNHSSSYSLDSSYYKISLIYSLFNESYIIFVCYSSKPKYLV